MLRTSTLSEFFRFYTNAYQLCRPPPLESPPFLTQGSTLSSLDALTADTLSENRATCNARGGKISRDERNSEWLLSTGGPVRISHASLATLGVNRSRSISEKMHGPVTRGQSHLSRILSWPSYFPLLGFGDVETGSEAEQRAAPLPRDDGTTSTRIHQAAAAANEFKGGRGSVHLIAGHPSSSDRRCVETPRENSAPVRVASRRVRRAHTRSTDYNGFLIAPCCWRWLICRGAKRHGKADESRWMKDERTGAARDACQRPDETDN